jgi:hypothetical protein
MSELIVVSLVHRDADGGSSQRVWFIDEATELKIVDLLGRVPDAEAMALAEAALAAQDAVKDHEGLVVVLKDGDT